jgi:mannan endo-1,4-beta-mannosidase
MIGRRRLLQGILAGGAAALAGCGPALPEVRLPLVDQAVWGGYASTQPYPDCTAHFELERLLGVRLQWMSWFFNWSVPWPTVGGQQAADGGYDILLAWQPRLDRRRVIFADVLAGEYDDYLTRFFTMAAAHPGQVMIRLAHEMNGTGYPWALGYRGENGSGVSSTTEFVDTWRYVVDFQRRVGGDNVRFQWCIMTADRGGVPAERFYPGDDHVDTLGMDVYNGYDGWQEPRAAISFTYRRLAAINSHMPLWISELGCREPRIREESGDGPIPGKSKARWLETLFATTEFPRITNVNFFHAARAYDWRLNSSPDALETCRAALGSPT